MFVGQGVELGQSKDFTGPLPPSFLVSPNQARLEEQVGQMLSRVVLGPEDEILEDRHIAQFVRDLPRLREAQVNDLKGRESVDPGVTKPNLATIGAVQSCDEIEQGRFPGSVRSDEAGDGLRRNRQRTVVHRANPAEGFAHVLDPEDQRRFAPFGHRKIRFFSRRIPSGR